VTTTSDNAGSQRIQLPDGSLFFLKAMEDVDAGVYWCLAKNEYGEVRSRNATLEIACKCAE
jgi:roundabout axon guidance receptor 2